jgi:hypothetical protein
MPYVQRQHPQPPQQRSLVIRIGLVLFVATLLSAPAMARVERFVQIAYWTQTGWSDYYTREVEFVTGKELNASTKTLDFDIFAAYALVWFANDEVAIIKLSPLTTTIHSPFDGEGFKKLYWAGEATVLGNQVNSRPQGRFWKIRGRDDNLRFIDPRARQ